MTRDLGELLTGAVARHTVSHWLYRSWCAHCVTKRGGEEEGHHRRKASQSRTISVLRAGFCFIGGGKVINLQCWW